MVGLRPKLSEKIFRASVIISAIFFLAAPNAFAVLYYGFIASDQFQSETRFTVRTSAPALGKDQLGKATGIPSAKIVQDTQIVAEFITSKGMIDALSESIDIRSIYAAPGADVLSRLEDEASAEDLLSYWQDMVSAAISPASGIITVKVRAFSADDAQRILIEVVRAAESAVNNMNARIWRDVTQTAQENQDRAAVQLRIARENLQAARNKTGMLSIEGTASVLTALIGNIERERLELQQRYEVQSQSVAKDAPQLVVLHREIVSKERQIKELQGQLAGSTVGQDQTLADASVTFAQRQMEQNLAEKQFSASVKTMEQIKFVSRQQLLYLDSFLSPDRPDSPKFPKRFFWIVATFLSSLVAWGAVLSGLALIRRRIA
ncbi:capsule biosynthesis protein [Ensifer sp. SL37]|uniref:capsule biosynthesis protein n=1 Tax=Ensifer sp. SL37 TaxID=2995137 RepID=UPI0022727756|nr:capsule biosynthesis protein [Ensifer sp. SL37]MCY1740360.1 capsule biosynthesis protein [Ensifer sp. SL37]